MILRSLRINRKYLVLLAQLLLLLLMILKTIYLTLVIQLKKNRLWCKNKEIEGKYLTTFDYNKFTNETLVAKIENKRLVNKSENSEFIKQFDLHNLATKAELKAEQDKIVNLQTYDSSPFVGQSFISDGCQNFLIFEPIFD